MVNETNLDRFTEATQKFCDLYDSDGNILEVIYEGNADKIVTEISNVLDSLGFKKNGFYHKPLFSLLEIIAVFFVSFLLFLFVYIILSIIFYVD